jgi:hypothetical protein
MERMKTLVMQVAPMDVDEENEDVLVRAEKIQKYLLSLGFINPKIHASIEDGVQIHVSLNVPLPDNEVARQFIRGMEQG